MSTDWQRDITEEMINVYNQKVRSKPTTNIPEDEINLRKSLIKEEVVKELIPAMDEGNLEKIADGIVDSIVVLLGTANTYGINVQPIWDEVHRTNLNKAGGPMRDDGKRLKPKGWKGPNIQEILDKQSQ